MSNAFDIDFKEDCKHAVDALIVDIKNRIGDFENLIQVLCNVPITDGRMPDESVINSRKWEVFNHVYKILIFLSKHHYDFASVNADAYITVHCLLLTRGYSLYNMIVGDLYDKFPEKHPAKWFISSPFIKKTLINIQQFKLDHVLRIGSLMTLSGLSVTPNIISCIVKLLPKYIAELKTMSLVQQIPVVTMTYILNIMFNLGHQSRSPKNYISIKSNIMDYYNWQYTITGPNVKEVAFFMINPKCTSSDYYGLSTFIDVIRNVDIRLQLYIRVLNLIIVIIIMIQVYVDFNDNVDVRKVLTKKYDLHSMDV